MKFKTPNCPECGEQVMGTSDMIPGCALVVYDEDSDSFDYEGETEVFWDGQENCCKADNLMELQCHNGHVWDSEFTVDDEKEEEVYITGVTDKGGES